MDQPHVPNTEALPESPKRFTLFNPKYRWPRRIFLGLITLGVLAFLGMMIYVSFNLPSFQEIENPQSDLSTQIISADGQTLQTLYSRENRTNVRLDEISPYVIDALIATEDARFYRHPGIDPKSFFSILAEFVKSGELRGGSTITMQLARNLYQNVGQQTQYIRKFKEYLVSAFIERRFTKEEIIVAYLNTVNIYGTSYGIETTSRRLFDKPAKQLTIEEAALLVGMLKGQGVYNPYRYQERTQERRNTVIDQMVKYGVLDSTKINVDSIQQLPIVVMPPGQDHVRGLAPYYREHVRHQLDKWCKEKGYDLYTDGLRVYTTLDSRMQLYAENAMQEHLQALQVDFDREQQRDRMLDKDPNILRDLKHQSPRYKAAVRAGKSEAAITKEFQTKTKMAVFSWKGEIDTVMTPMDSLRYMARFLETGMISIDPTNGHVKSWVGGINYKYFKYDHVSTGKRQVGSTFKPFVYASAIEEFALSPCEIIPNSYIEVPLPDGTNWAPTNSDGTHGNGENMTLRRGLATSTNIITARLIDRVGAESAANMAHKMGIKTELDKVPSLALGTTDLTVKELTSAYSTLVNHGVYIEPIVITRIENQYGQILHEFVPETKDAMTERAAAVMVDLLRGVVDQPGGTAQRLRWKYKFDNPIGGKTGTTQNNSDGWFVGITPNLVSGVWVGCADRRMRFENTKYGQGANMALPIWALYMQKLYQDPDIRLPTQGFEIPEGVSLPAACENTAPSDSTTTNDPVFEPDDLEGF